MFDAGRPIRFTVGATASFVELTHEGNIDVTMDESGNSWSYLVPAQLVRRNASGTLVFVTDGKPSIEVDSTLIDIPVNFLAGKSVRSDLAFRLTVPLTFTAGLSSAFHSLVHSLTVVAVNPAEQVPVLIFAFAGTLVGALTTAIGAWIVGRQQAQHDRRMTDVARLEQDRRELSERIGDYLAATYYAVLSLRALAISGRKGKRAAYETGVLPSFDRVNRALVAIEVNDPDSVIDAATRLNRAMVALVRLAMDQDFSAESWRTERDTQIADLPGAVKRATREEIARLRQAGS